MPARLTIDDARRLAESRGGRCLSEKYVNSATKLVWSCSHGHEWQATYNKIQRGHWCHHCAGNIPKVDQDYHDLAKKRNGFCLSVGSSTHNPHSRWKCSEGHEWDAPYSGVLQGRWCPRCAGLAPKNSNDYHDLAKKRNGACLHVGKNVHDKSTRWRCVEGHEWSSAYHNVQQGKWCTRCAGLFPKAPEDYHQLAKERGGECLIVGKSALDNSSLWQCSEKHQWNAHYNSIQQGTWCPHCAGLSPRTPEDYRALAESRNGQCLFVGKNVADNSSRWRCSEGHEWNAQYYGIQQGHWCSICAGVARKTDNDYHDLAKQCGGVCLVVGRSVHDNFSRWRCSEGHEWNAAHHSIRKGQWCPECSAGKSERAVRLVIETMTGVPVPKCKKFHDVNPRGIEFDGYNEDLKLALERQGEQHYMPVRFGGISKERAESNLERQQRRDELRRSLCEQNGITLLEVPYWIKPENIEDFIISELINAGRQDVVDLIEKRRAELAAGAVSP